MSQDDNVIGPRYAMIVGIKDVHETAFLPQGLNEFFFAKHDFKIGDKVKITIQRIADENEPQPASPARGEADQ